MKIFYVDKLNYFIISFQSIENIFLFRSYYIKLLQPALGYKRTFLKIFHNPFIIKNYCDNTHSLTTDSLPISNEETFLPRFSRNSEAYASEFLENLEEMLSG